MGGGRAGAVLRMRTHRLENALELLLRQVVEEQGHPRLDVLHERPRLLGQAKQAIPHALVVGVSAARKETKEVRGGSGDVRSMWGLSSGRKVWMETKRLGVSIATL